MVCVEASRSRWVHFQFSKENKTNVKFRVQHRPQTVVKLLSLIHSRLDRNREVGAEGDSAPSCKLEKHLEHLDWWSPDVCGLGLVESQPQLDTVVIVAEVLI